MYVNNNVIFVALHKPYSDVNLPRSDIIINHTFQKRGKIHKSATLFIWDEVEIEGGLNTVGFTVRFVREDVEYNPIVEIGGFVLSTKRFFPVLVASFLPAVNALRRIRSAIWITYVTGIRHSAERVIKKGIHDDHVYFAFPSVVHPPKVGWVLSIFVTGTNSFRIAMAGDNGLTSVFGVVGEDNPLSWVVKPVRRFVRRAILLGLFFGL